MFDRSGSTLGIMDDLQIAIHSYDGCHKSCAGCLVDTHFKNKRQELILTDDQFMLIQDRVEEYFYWLKKEFKNRPENHPGYFKTNSFSLDHYSYTFRFGNHGELPIEQLDSMLKWMKSKFIVMSTAPDPDISKFIILNKLHPDRKLFLEIIYDPVHDDVEKLKNMIQEMRKYNILGYPEVVLTKKILSSFSSEDFINKVLIPLGQIQGDAIQIQFGRYSPSKTRKFDKKQMIHPDDEIDWLTGISKGIIDHQIKIHPIPLAEYAVTLLDEYKINLNHQSISQHDLDTKSTLAKTEDIFKTSLYIDHNLDVFLWSESMGQHVLDHNFGFDSIGNLLTHSIKDMILAKKGKFKQHLRNNIIHLNDQCSDCGLKSFCASHCINLFRKYQPDDGKHCYGYLPVIKEFQKDPIFLQEMINGFKRLGF